MTSDVDDDVLAELANDVHVPRWRRWLAGATSLVVAWIAWLIAAELVLGVLFDLGAVSLLLTTLGKLIGFLCSSVFIVAVDETVGDAVAHRAWLTPAERYALRSDDPS